MDEAREPYGGLHRARRVLVARNNPLGAAHQSNLKGIDP